MKDIKKYVDINFIDFPLTNEVKMLKEELYDSLVSKYDELLLEGKSEQEAYEYVIQQFGDIQELRHEFSIPHKLNIHTYITLNLLLIIGWVIYLIFSLTNKLDINFYLIIIYLTNGIFILRKVFKNNEYEWLFAVFPLGILSFFESQYFIGFILIILGLVFLIKLFKSYKINFSYLLLNLSFIVAIDLNILNIVSNQINSYPTYTYSYINVVNFMYIFTVILNCFIFIIYTICISKFSKLNYLIIYSLISMNVIMSLFYILDLNYFSILPLLVNLYLLVLIGSRQKLKILLNKYLNVSVLSVVSIFIICFYFKTTYLFMPYEIKKSEVSNISWQDLKYPIQLEIMRDNQLEYSGYTVYDYNDISLLIKLFEKEEYITTTKQEWDNLEHLSSEQLGNKYVFLIQGNSSKVYNNSPYIYYFRFYENGSYISSGENEYYTYSISTEMKELLIKLINQN